MSLRKRSISGVGWNALGNFARQFLTILTLIVMARYLTPSDFGTYALVMVFVGFINILTSMSVSQALIHADNPSQRMISSIFYFNIAVGSFFFCLTYILARPIAVYFGQIELIKLLQLSGLNFIVISFGLVQKTLLEKSIQFKRVIILETWSLTLSSGLGMAAAISGLGVYSLILLSLMNSTILTATLWVNSEWKPSLKFSLEDIKKIWAYSLNLTAFSFVNYFARQSDNFLIGKFLGPGALGFYSLAYRIMLYPLENISRVVVRVLFPALSEIKQENQMFKRAYVLAISFIALITFPLMFGLMATAELFVSVLLGDKWNEIVILLIILSPIGLVQSIVTTVGSIYMAKGTTNLMLKVGTLNAVVTVLSFVIGIPFGTEGVAISYAIANILMLYPNLKVSWMQIDLGVFEGISHLAPFFLVSAIMSLCVYSIGRSPFIQGFSDVIVLSTQITLGIMIYIGLILTLYRKKLFRMLDMVGIRLPVKKVFR